MKLLFKVAIAGVLIAVLLSRLDWMEVVGMLERVNLPTLSVVLLAMCAEQAISAFKWSRALNMHGMNLPYTYLLRTVCTGFFLNNFLPTSVGGDAYRVYRTLPSGGLPSRAVSAVLVDRATGIFVLLTLGAAGATAHVASHPIAGIYLLAYCAGVAAGLLLLAALTSGFVNAWLERVQHVKVVDAILQNATYLRGAGMLWLQQIGLSLAFQLVSVSIVFWLFANTGGSVPFGQCALLAAAAGLVALLPLSLNGIGLMEGSFVATAVMLGIDYDQALLVAIVRRLMMLFLSLLCGGVYLCEGRVVLPVDVRPPGVKVVS